MPSPKAFIWYELMTTDPAAAAEFYASVVGWRPQAWQGAMPYTVMNAGEDGVAGIMAMPEEYRASGGPPAWMGYIEADDVDAATASLKQAGGIVHRPPADIPDVGRFAVVADPQGAGFMLLQPKGPGMAPPPPATPGHIGWRELYATDWPGAFDFYASQFGWTKGDAVDMGAMGVYQLFAAGGEAIGGMMNRPPNIPMPVWLFYFNVEAIDAAAARATEKGGKVVNGPHQVPGGTWIVQCVDPQGAMFALTAPKR